MDEGSSTQQKTHNLRITAATMVVFFFLYSLVGMLFSTPLLSGVVRQIMAFSWSYTQCVITDTVGGPGQEVRPQVLYSYNVGDNRLQNVWAGPYQSIDSFQADFFIGKVVPCRFDPQNPRDAIFAALQPREMALQGAIALASLIFALLGCSGLWLVGCFWKRKSDDIKRSSSPAWRWLRPQPDNDRVPADGTGGTGDKGTTAEKIDVSFVPIACGSRGSTLRFKILACAMLCGGTGLGAFFFLKNLTSPYFAYLLLALSIIGAFLLLRLAAMSARLKLWLSDTEIHPGEELSIRWRLYDRRQKVERLGIALRGEEQATSAAVNGRGPSKTNRATFAFFPLMQAAGKERKRSGVLRTQIPPGIMPTFKAENTAIIWTLLVKGETADWPDMIEECEIDVTPRVAQVQSGGA